MTAINTTIPTEEQISAMSKKRITESVGNRLTSIKRSNMWLKEKIAERGMKTRITSNSPAQIVEMFKIIEEERKRLKKEMADMGMKTLTTGAHKPKTTETNNKPKRGNNGT